MNARENAKRQLMNALSAIICTKGDTCLGCPYLYRGTDCLEGILKSTIRKLLDEEKEKPK